MAAYLGDTDSEDELPPGWEERVHHDGRVYYADHSTQTTTWIHPKSGKRKVVPNDLPYGWKKEKDESGVEIFFEEATGKRTYTDPRLAFARDAKESLYDFKQRFDASTQALAVLNGVDLTNKKALVTGANSGIGYETARSLALHGCEVIFACRNIDRAAEAMNKIKEEKPTAVLEFVQLDLNSLQSVKNCANELMMKYQSLDIVICNAGIFGAPFGLTEDNYEQTFQINYLSHMYLVLLIKPLLILTHSTRILFVASESHRFSMLTMENLTEEYLSPTTAKKFTSFMAFNDSKLCIVILASEINRRWAVHGITANSVHPGNMVSTGLSRNSYLYKAMFAAVRPFTKSLQQAAATTIWGATAHELNGVGGMYLNNCWLCVPVKKAEDPVLAKVIWNMSIELIERKVGPISTLRRFGGSVDVEEDDQVSGGIPASG
ncbi:WW domain-containing oxidoreductase [Orchesella cincta]|uniref:WW domain-containing oxidoreductase n=1 Tax=Orchesella cincta TaxID=48709 RepID=A0A1D2N5P5_ORCCI|nr:WW domain-containing oxidoreductase [Orchesella cincta]